MTSFWDWRSGKITPPETALIRRVEGLVSNWPELRTGGVYVVHDYVLHRMRGFPKPDENLVQFVERTAEYRDHVTDKESAENSVLSLIIDYAQQDSLFWGIIDPYSEGHCTNCDKVKPLSRFVGTRCTRCYETRRAARRKEHSDEA